MNDQPFEIFGGVHIFSLLIIVLMTVWLSLVYKDRTDDQKSGMAKILAYILIAHIALIAHQRSFYTREPI